MKKILAVASMGISVAFAIALANAQDNSSTTTDSTYSSSTTTQQQPGTTDQSQAQGSQSQDQPGTMGSDSSMHQPGTAEGTMTKEEHWKSMKSCTDQSGKTLHKGDRGFKNCLKQMKKSEMGGTGSTSDQSSTGMSSSDKSSGSSSMGTSSGSDSSSSNQ